MSDTAKLDELLDGNGINKPFLYDEICDLTLNDLQYLQQQSRLRVKEYLHSIGIRYVLSNEISEEDFNSISDEFARIHGVACKVRESSYRFLYKDFTVLYDSEDSTVCVLGSWLSKLPILIHNIKTFIQANKQREMEDLRQKIISEMVTGFNAKQAELPKCMLCGEDLDGEVGNHIECDFKEKSFMDQR